VLKESIRSRILNVAFSAFSESGYTKTKLSEIAMRADVAAGLVNKYFESKEKLFYELIKQRVFGVIFPDNDLTSFNEELDHYLNLIKEAIRKDDLFSDFMRMLVTSVDLPFQPEARVYGIPAAESMLKGIKQAQELGRMPNTQSSGMLLYGMAKGTVIVCRWFKSLELPMPENDQLLFMIGYDRRAVLENRPTYFELQKNVKQRGKKE